MMKRTFLYLNAVFFLTALLFLQPAALLARQTGELYKMAVPEDGVYKIDAAFLRKMNLDPATINPQNIRIFGFGGGMLPQPNASVRPENLPEIAVFAPGQSDGKFDETDFILFYGQGPHRIFAENQSLRRELNLYTDKNYYFLKIDDSQAGRRITETEFMPGGRSVTSYARLAAHEKEETNLLMSGRKWLGELANGISPEITFEIPAADALPGGRAVLHSRVFGSSDTTNYFEVRAGSKNVIFHQIAGSEDLYDWTYALRGNFDERIADFVLDGNILANDKIILTYKYDNAGQSKAYGHTDAFDLTLPSRLAFSDKTLAVRSFESTQFALSQFEIETAATDLLFWDVSRPESPESKKGEFAAGKASFSAETAGDLRTFAVFSPETAAVPEFVKKADFRDLRQITPPNLVIIAPAAFLAEAERLAEFRRTNDGLSVEVADLESVYDNFASGRQDVSAVRDFARHLYQKAGGNFRYLLLFGDASFDYKNKLSNTINIVPTYQSRESADPVETYSSDDYYAFLSDSEGEWREAGYLTDGSTMDIGVGRLPVKNEREARGIVNKLIRYEASESLGDWRNRISFVADDGDNNIYLDSTEKMADYLDENYPLYNLKKYYLDAYPQVLETGGRRSPALRKKLKEALEQGSLLVNFVGHGSELGWTQENIFSYITAAALRNPDRPAIYITATCEFGRFDNPARVSGGEYAVLNASGGAIALLTTGRPVYSHTNSVINNAFYRNVFRGKNLRLGDISRLTKNESASGVFNRNFTLLGDPSMRPAFPRGQAVITDLHNAAGQTRTFRALEKIGAAGEIRDENGIFDPEFNGTIDVEVYDKAGRSETLGDESSPAEYFERDRLLFKGKAKVTNGKFTFEFIVPKDIDYQTGKGKISLYAQDPARNTDAGGFDAEINVEGGSGLLVTDLQAPEIRLFMDTLTFKDGGIVRPDCRLIALFEDESGINITNSGLGHDIIATLDGETEFNLTEYYRSDINTYQSGSLQFDFTKLEEGPHTLRLTARDNANNSGFAEINFVVQKESFSVTELLPFPNPFSDRLNISFVHNRPGEDLDIEIEIYSADGRLVRQLSDNVFNTGILVEGLSWDGKSNSAGRLLPGLYILRLRTTVRSSGEVTETACKVLLF